LGRAVD